MTHGNEQIPDELLSGFLDDELNEKERKLVENLLEKSERHRKTLAELRVLREGLQSLPQNSLDAKFHERVLNKIGRTNEIVRSSPSPAADVSSRRSHRMFWTVLSIAACFVLMFGYFEWARVGNEFNVAQKAEQDASDPNFAVPNTADKQKPEATKLHEDRLSLPQDNAGEKERLDMEPFVLDSAVGEAESQEFFPAPKLDASSSRAVPTRRQQFPVPAERAKNAFYLFKNGAFAEDQSEFIFQVVSNDTENARKKILQAFGENSKPLRRNIELNIHRSSEDLYAQDATLTYDMTREDLQSLLFSLQEAEHVVMAVNGRSSVPAQIPRLLRFSTRSKTPANSGNLSDMDADSKRKNKAVTEAPEKKSFRRSESSDQNDKASRAFAGITAVENNAEEATTELKEDMEAAETDAVQNDRALNPTEEAKSAAAEPNSKSRSRKDLKSDKQSTSALSAEQKKTIRVSFIFSQPTESDATSNETEESKTDK